MPKINQVQSPSDNENDHNENESHPLINSDCVIDIDLPVSDENTNSEEEAAALVTDSDSEEASDVTTVDVSDIDSTTNNSDSKSSHANSYMYYNENNRTSSSSSQKRYHNDNRTNGKSSSTQSYLILCLFIVVLLVTGGAVFFILYPDNPVAKYFKNEKKKPKAQIQSQVKDNTIGKTSSSTKSEDSKSGSDSESDSTSDASKSSGTSDSKDSGATNKDAKVQKKDQTLTDASDPKNSPSAVTVTPTADSKSESGPPSPQIPNNKYPEPTRTPELQRLLDSRDKAKEKINQHDNNYSRYQNPEDVNSGTSVVNNDANTSNYYDPNNNPNMVPLYYNQNNYNNDNSGFKKDESHSWSKTCNDNCKECCDNSSYCARNCGGCCLDTGYGIICCPCLDPVTKVFLWILLVILVFFAVVHFHYNIVGYDVYFAIAAGIFVFYIIIGLCVQYNICSVFFLTICFLCMGIIIGPSMWYIGYKVLPDAAGYKDDIDLGRVLDQHEGTLHTNLPFIKNHIVDASSYAEWSFTCTIIGFIITLCTLCFGTMAMIQYCCPPQGHE